MQISTLERNVLQAVNKPKEKKYDHFFQDKEVSHYNNPAKVLYPLNDEVLKDLIKRPDLSMDIFYPHKDLDNKDRLKYVIEILQTYNFTNVTGQPTPYGLYKDLPHPE